MSRNIFTGKASEPAPNEVENAYARMKSHEKG
jgi:hypothetical protein